MHRPTDAEVGVSPEVPHPQRGVRDLVVDRFDLAARMIGPGADGTVRRAAVAHLVTSRLADLWDTAVADLATAEGIALGAVGSLGRSDASPASDLDLLLVHDGRTHDAATVAAVAERLWYPIWDSGVHLDHSVRSLAQCRQVASADLPAAVGLLDLRHVAGDRTVITRARTALLTDWRAAARQSVRRAVRARVMTVRSPATCRRSSSPTAAGRSADATCRHWASERTEWSRCTLESQIGYHSRSATAATVAPSCTRSRSRSEAGLASDRPRLPTAPSAIPSVVARSATAVSHRSARREVTRCATAARRTVPSAPGPIIRAARSNLSTTRSRTPRWGCGTSGDTPTSASVGRCIGHKAPGPCSPVRTRATSSTGTVHTLPSPILPECAAPTMASVMATASSSATSTSMRTLGIRSTWYSAPR